MTAYMEDFATRQWQVFMPLYRQVLNSPYLVTALKDIVTLVRKEPDPENLFIHTARALGLVINRRVKILRIDHGYYKGAKIINAWLAPL